MRISVELIPRGEAEVLADAATVRAALPAANTFNIPDLMRFPLRSWDACALARSVLPAAIPHIRAIDIPPGDEQALGDTVAAAGLTEVLVIKGDPPSDMSRHTYPNSSEAVIQRLKRHHPNLRVYAAFDPYRQGFRDELAEVDRKRDAGADGFFTQPLFDLRLLTICAEMLRGTEVFWGIAPVLGERSKAYWETTNRVVFPPDFSPTLEWNREFARAAVGLISSLAANVYFMPIKVNLAKYFDGLLDGNSA
ncbi:methylenetetrahydrofolate reductase [Acidisphaera sp. L21]|uniref:methylenetetrahydrofolate reductase n=1 Tax=Acidisphaera sp. L21 TaxID=1641851 RepID=UPI00131C61AF|nr:methylenetetrahydrofolate reductase [Acidisphaera sp. L21]